MFLGGKAIYSVLLVLAPSAASTPYLGDFMGINALEFGCFWIFWCINLVISIVGTGISRSIERSLN